MQPPPPRTGLMCGKCSRTILNPSITFYHKFQGLTQLNSGQSSSCPGRAGHGDPAPLSVCPCVRVGTDLCVPCTRTCKDTQPLRSRAPCAPRAFDVTLYSCMPAFLQTSPVTQDLNHNSGYSNTHTQSISSRAALSCL